MMSRELLNFPPTAHSKLLAQWFGNSMLPPEANAGLVFDRFFRIWNFQEDRLNNLSPKTLRPKAIFNPAPRRNESAANPLGHFVEDFNQRPTGATLSMHHNRIKRLLAGCGHPNETLTLQTVSRLAIGLGAAHPTENSLTLDPLLGVPYLPGSSIKGACRAWSAIEAESNRIEADRVQALFGSAPPSNRSSDPESAGMSGALQFMAAHPTSQPKLAVEIVNNHHMQYYGAGAKARAKPDWRFEPLDIESPNPAYFLVVEARVPFAFHVLATDGQKKTLSQGLEILKAALVHIGIGAKTSVGYGRFAE